MRRAGLPARRRRSLALGCVLTLIASGLLAGVHLPREGPRGTPAAWLPSDCPPPGGCPTADSASAAEHPRSDGSFPADLRNRWVSNGSGGPPEGLTMTYDAAEGVLMMLNLSPTTSAPVATWVLTQSWTPLNLTVEPSCINGAFLFASLAYDPLAATADAVLTTVHSDCLWQYRDFAWTEAPQILTADLHPEAVTFDSGSDRLLLAGPGSTWEFYHGNWTNLTSGAQPPPSISPFLVYDPSTNASVFFGGSDPGSGNTNSATWRLVGDNWTNVSSWSPAYPDPDNLNQSNSTLSSTPFDEAAAFDPVDQYIVLVHEPTRGFPPTTWTYGAGNWTNASGRMPSQPVFGPGFMAFDGALGKIVFWSGVAGFWTLDPYGALLISAFAPSPDLVDVGQAVHLSVDETGGLAPLQFLYPNPPAGCLPYNGPDIVCTPLRSGTFEVAVNLTDWVGEYTTASTTFNVNPAPTVSNFNLTPATTDAGQPVNGTVVPEGGTPPYHYSYTGIPAGCASVDSPTWSCTPADSGRYSVTVHVVDQLGETTSIAHTLLVYDPLRVSSVTASPASPVAGENFTLDVVFTGGSPIDAFAFDGLPSGCPSVNSSQLTCSAAVAIELHITVVVRDSVGGQAVAAVTLDVVAAPHPTHPPPPAFFLPLVIVGVGAGLAALIVWAWRRSRPPPVEIVYVPSESRLRSR